MRTGDMNRKEGRNKDRNEDRKYEWERGQE
jgi:hypothetical protein